MRKLVQATLVLPMVIALGACGSPGGGGAPVEQCRPRTAGSSAGGSCGTDEHLAAPDRGCADRDLGARDRIR